LKNLRIDIVAVLLLCLGSFLFPGLSYAHASTSANTMHSSCSKKGDKKATMKDCCHAKSNQKTKDNGCNSKCKHRSCRCCASCPTVSLALVCDFKIENQLFAIEKAQIGYKQSKYTFGFISIWQPPKIA